MFYKNKLGFSIVLISLLAFSAFMVGSQPVAAVDLASYAFISVSPNIVGINEQVLVLMWLSSVPPTAQGVGGDRWQGYQCTITKPDGTTENKGPFSSDAVAGAYFLYKPTIPGKYYFQFSFPGQRINATGNYYLPSTSPSRAHCHSRSNTTLP